MRKVARRTASLKLLKYARRQYDVAALCRGLTPAHNEHPNAALYSTPFKHMARLHTDHFLLTYLSLLCSYFMLAVKWCPLKSLKHRSLQINYQAEDIVSLI